MTFRDCIQRVFRNTRKNTKFFAQRCTLRTDGGKEYRLTCHQRHTIRPNNEPDGSVTLIDQLRVEIDKDDLDHEPTFGDRILVNGDDKAYLYAYSGKHTLVSWHVVFERRRDVAQGTRVMQSGRRAG